MQHFLIPFKFHQISHLTLHNAGFGTRKIFLSEKNSQNRRFLRECLNNDSEDSMITLIKSYQREVIISPLTRGRLRGGLKNDDKVNGSHIHSLIGNLHANAS